MSDKQLPTLLLSIFSKGRRDSGTEPE
ncbi:hypothetical protein AVEN_41622-1, partial [Araneus ventricosus]